MLHSCSAALGEFMNLCLYVVPMHVLALLNLRWSCLTAVLSGSCHTVPTYSVALAFIAKCICCKGIWLEVALFDSIPFDEFMNLCQ